MAKKHDFPGFGPAATAFLTELTNNNNREWFEANKARYEAEVREPARAFVRAMEPRLKKVSKELVADDRKVGGSLMRIYRDTRFSKDKTPYKTNVGIQFRHRLGKDVHAPGAYVHLGLDGCFLGVGVYRPEADALAKIRTLIDADPKRYRRVVEDKKLRAAWRLGGESLKRPPKGFDKDHPLVEELKRKDHILVQDLTVERAESPELPDLVLAQLMVGKKHTKMLCDALGIGF